MDIVRGSVVVSVAGRDKDRCFAVLKTDGEFALVADGRYRCIGKAKRKKFKHMKPLGVLPDLNEGVTNRELWRMLSSFRESLNNLCGRL